MKKIKKNLFGIGLALAMIMGIGFGFMPKNVNAEQGGGSGGDDFIWAYCAAHSQFGSVIWFMNGIGSCVLLDNTVGDGNQAKCYRTVGQ